MLRRASPHCGARSSHAPSTTPSAWRRRTSRRSARRDDPASLPVRELKRLIELHGAPWFTDAIDKAEFATALRETLKNCPICLDELDEVSEDGWPAAVRCGACRGTPTACAPRALPRVGRLGPPAAAVPHVPRGPARAHRQGGARARRGRRSKIQHRRAGAFRAAHAAATRRRRDDGGDARAGRSGPCPTRRRALWRRRWWLR